MTIKAYLKITEVIDYLTIDHKITSKDEVKLNYSQTSLYDLCDHSEIGTVDLNWSGKTNKSSGLRNRLGLSEIKIGELVILAELVSNDKDGKIDYQKKIIGKTLSGEAVIISSELVGDIMHLEIELH